ncbi:MAG: 1-deoxy-D-xylulose-5-phosphate reductoisomerase [Alphaproteobacteria bacterium]
MSERRTINIFGVTGSVGQSTADVILAHSALFSVQYVTAHKDADALAKMALALGARYAVLASDDAETLSALEKALEGSGIIALGGAEAMQQAARHRVDVNVMAIVGMAGLTPIMEALEHCRFLALANKEPLVAAGPFVMEKARQYQVQILPLDSEHNAIFQVFDPKQALSVEKIILTASGGPFLDWPLERIEKASVAEAVNHPNWSMGQKISVDSATMMNKALEVIEAYYLFALPPDKIDVVVHPQSIVHSMVEYCDGSVLAQMGASDMRTPIANVLYCDKRLKTPGKILNIKELSTLEFREVDAEKFPAIAMAYEALEQGLYATIALNAANECAVFAFLREGIAFAEIINCVRSVVDSINKEEILSLEDVFRVDALARASATRYIETLNPLKTAVISS